MKKILLVSDRERFLVRNKSLLNRAGFIIISAASAEEALRIYREQPVDLLITMLDLPHAGGDFLCTSIRNDQALKQVPIIVVCYETEADLERAARCRANASLIRPVQPELLLKQIGRFLDIPTRREYRAVFNATVNGISGNLTFTGMTRNISITGMLCETDVLLAQDDLVENLLFAIDSDELSADGRIVWSERRPDGQYHYGLHFTALSPGGREKIESFVTIPAEARHSRTLRVASQR